MAILFFRTLIIFTMLLVLMRLLGKRQMGELELSELVVSVLVADLAAMPIQDIGIPLMNGIVPVLILFSCELIVSGLTVKSVRLRAVLCGRPCMLIRNGKIRQDDMRRCRFTVDELAEVCHMSTSHFYACFKNAVGMSPIEYKNSVCINRAMLRLVSEDKTIEEISEELGFESAAYFRKVFKRVTGKTPKEYRKSAGEK